MNRLIFFTVALYLVFTTANAQSGSDTEVDSEISEEPTTDADTTNNSTYYTTEDLPNLDLGDLTNSDSLEARDDEMATEMALMMTFITKTFADMSRIAENMKSMSNKSNIDEDSMKNLVNHLVSFKEDDSTLEDQVKRVMELRQEFKSEILKNLKNMPINIEDAKKMEVELRNQMNQRLPNISTSNNLMDLPASMQNILPN